MKHARLLIALLLLSGLVACEADPGDPGVDASRMDEILSDHGADRAFVVAALGDARGGTLESSDALDRAAVRHAMELAGGRTFTHIGADGSSPRSRGEAYGAGLGEVREFLFQIEGDPEDLGRTAARTWLAPLENNAVLTQPATHAAVAFAPRPEGGYVGVLLLAQP